MDIKLIKEMPIEQLQDSELYDFIIQEKSADAFCGQLMEEAMFERARTLKRFNSVKRLYDTYRRSRAQKATAVGGNVTRFTEQPLQLRCGEWIADDAGIRKTVINGGGDAEAKIASRTPMLITEIYKNGELIMNNEKVKLEYSDVGIWKSMTVPASVITDAVTLQRTLSGNGIDVTSNSAKLLVDYFQCIKTGNREIIPTVDSIDRLGWLDGGFTPYNGLVFDGEADNREIFRAIHEKGDYEEWKKTVVSLMSDSVFLRLQMAASFASPLVEPLHINPFILHLHGGTGSGKTVGLMAAMSVWGNPSKGRMWRSMDNTITYVTQTAAVLYNLPVGLDELQLIKGRASYNTLIMKLCEGIDRGRCEGTRKRDTLTWHNVFLTTGEDPIIQDSSGGGAVNRVIELDCNSNVVVRDGKAVVDFLLNNYGHAGKEYIKGIQRQQKLNEMYRSIYSEILEKSPATEKQASAMAAILLGDLMANAWVFQGELEPLNVEDVAEFLADNKTVDIDERAYRYVLDLAAANADRFGSISYGEAWGQITSEGVIEWNKTILLREMLNAGFDFNACKKIWAKKGYLMLNSQNKYVHQTDRGGIRYELVKIRQTQKYIQEAINNDNLPF